MLKDKLTYIIFKKDIIYLNRSITERRERKKENERDLPFTALLSKWLPWPELGRAGSGAWNSIRASHMGVRLQTSGRLPGFPRHISWKLGWK